MKDKYTFFVVLLSVFCACIVQSKTIEEKDLVGSWKPSGEMPREKGVKNYILTIDKDFKGRYSSVNNPNFLLDCEYKKSSTQNSIFVYYCFLNKNHLITLALSGWVSGEGEKSLYGFEYWLGYPAPGDVHGGLPVSLIPDQ